MKTVQDLIDRLMSVSNKDAEFKVVSTDGTYDITFTPNSYDFSIVDNKKVVILKMYR